MNTADVVLAVATALMVAYSGVAKLRHDPYVVKVIHEVVGVRLRWFPLLAACELAGAIGLLVGLVWPPIGVAAGVGLVVYFVGAVLSHVRVGDYTGIGPAAFMLALSAAALYTRILTS
jgi:uncharacterized membrane protein YphA (DoxX/SURF4 family)